MFVTAYVLVAMILGDIVGLIKWMKSGKEGKANQDSAIQGGSRKDDECVHQAVCKEKDTTCCNY